MPSFPVRTLRPAAALRRRTPRARRSPGRSTASPPAPAPESPPDPLGSGLARRLCSVSSGACSRTRGGRRTAASGPCPRPSARAARCRPRPGWTMAILVGSPRPAPRATARRSGAAGGRASPSSGKRPPSQARPPLLGCRGLWRRAGGAAQASAGGVPGRRWTGAPGSAGAPPAAIAASAPAAGPPTGLTAAPPVLAVAAAAAAAVSAAAAPAG
mmetsp:Transcript_10032/g.29549  ORF Transcript_10032/g.29549 Transcript_10032/m.29549 type:complete len:214 (-) Transcript_10032:107-748(-)